MKTARRKGYALLYVIAALPLIAVIGNFAAQIIGQALRAQRIAVAESADDAMLRLLMIKLRRDARTATDVRVPADGFGDSVIVHCPDHDVEYTVEGRTVTRVVRAGEVEQARSAWNFQQARCAFRIEEAAAGRPLLWVRCAAELHFRKNLPVQRCYATALLIGQGGVP